MKKEETRNLVVRVLLGAVMFASLAAGQGVQPAASSLVSQPPASIGDRFNPLRFPIQIRGAVLALGDRLQVAGKERTTVNGTFATPNGASAAVVTYELPNKARIDESGFASHSVGYDGSKSWTSQTQLSEQDQNLLETLLEDSPEGMLRAITETASLRVIATLARFDDGKAPHYSGPLVDIFQVVGPVPSSGNASNRLKHYYFDSRTHLLLEVSYWLKHSDGSSAAVRIIRSNWTNVGGQFIPGDITRVENGKTLFTFTMSAVALSPAVQDGKFTAP